MSCCACLQVRGSTIMRNYAVFSHLKTHQRPDDISLKAAFLSEAWLIVIAPIRTDQLFFITYRKKAK